MRREAGIVAGPGVCVVVGGDGSRIVERIDAALDGDIKAIVSIGIAGALSPSLKIGDCVVAAHVIGNQEKWPCDPAWHANLLRVLPDARPGAIVGVRSPATDIQTKARLLAASGADAVDMESDLAAQAAARRGLPFAALRVISDGAADALPPATASALDPDGGVALGSVLRAVLAKPSQIPALIRTGRNAERAFAALLRCRDLLGIGLGCPYLG